MEQHEFEALVKTASAKDDLPQALQWLRTSDHSDIVTSAEELTGQFSIAAHPTGVEKIYHVFTEKNDLGVDEEFVEYVMDKNDDVIVFIAWFFYTQFGIKHRDTFAAAGKTYKQPKRQ